ncbi:MAG: ankyrin repeat domain-containing protein kinase [Pseudomonadota bacterium]
MKTKLILLVSASTFSIASYAATATDKTQDRISKFQSHLSGAVIPEKSKQLISRDMVDRSDEQGTRSDAIYRLKTDSSAGTQSYIIKEGIDDRERQLVDSGIIGEWKKIISDYSRAHDGIKLPELTDYYAHHSFTEDGVEKNILLMQRAYGKTLTHIQREIGTLTEAEAIEMAQNIGQQMGALVRAFFTERRTFLEHGDANLANFMYSSRKKQFYWVDLGGTKEIPYTEQLDASDNNLYFSRETELFNYIRGAFISDHPAGRIQWLKSQKDVSEQDRVNYINTLKKERNGWLASKAFYDAYVAQVGDLEPYKALTAERPFVGSRSFIKETINMKERYLSNFREKFSPQESAEIINYITQGDPLTSSRGANSMAEHPAAAAHDRGSERPASPAAAAHDGRGQHAASDPSPSVVAAASATSHAKSLLPEPVSAFSPQQPPKALSRVSAHEKIAAGGSSASVSTAASADRDMSHMTKHDLESALSTAGTNGNIGTLNKLASLIPPENPYWMFATYNSAENNHLAAFQFLCKKNADTFTIDVFNGSLIRASRAGSLDVVQYLCTQNSVSPQAINDAFSYAIDYEQVDVIHYLRSHYAHLISQKTVNEAFIKCSTGDFYKRHGYLDQQRIREFIAMLMTPTERGLVPDIETLQKVFMAASIVKYPGEKELMIMDYIINNSHLDHAVINSAHQHALAQKRATPEDWLSYFQTKRLALLKKAAEEIA